MKKFIFLLAIFALLFSLAACGGAGTPADTTTTGSADTDAPKPELGENDIVVSPDGDDSAAGTLEAPLASISAAKEKAKSAPEGTEVTVWLRGGRYQMDETLIFDENDRIGVTYSAYGNEKPILSFGTPITGWKEGEINGVAAWVAAVPEDADISMLSSETELLNMSRYPEKGYFQVKWFDYDDVRSEESKSGKKTKSFKVNDEDMMDFENVDSIIFMAPLDSGPWKVSSSPVESINYETGILTLKYRDNASIATGNSYYFMNVREAVKNQGEWYYDRAEHLVYYIPRDGEKIDGFVLYSAGCADIMSINGADGLTFRGITFRDSGREDNLSSNGQTCTTRPKAVNIDHSDGTAFFDCEFRCIGRSAVSYNEDNQNGVISNCIFSGIGMVPILVHGTNVPNDDPTVTKNFTITNNLVENFSVLCHSASGICVCYVDTADISHNEVHDGHYTGISVGWTWEHGENPTQYISVKDNLIYNIGYGDTSDMGGIYTLGEQQGTVVSGNVIHDVGNHDHDGIYLGIYLDQGSSFITVEKNLVYNTDGAYTVTGTCDSVVVRNNIAAFSSPFGSGTKFIEYDHSLEVCRNIFTTVGDALYRISGDEEYGKYTFDDHDNLFFDYSGRSAEEYEIPDFCVNPIIADPLFADPDNFDFTISDESPALATGFEVWDYSEAGRK